MLARLRHLILLRNVGLEVGVPVIARVFELEELASSVHALEELFLRRNRQRDRLEQEAIGRDVARLEPLDERSRVVLRDAHILVADVDDHGRERCPRIGQMVLDLAGPEKRFHVGRASSSDADHMHAVRRLCSGRTVVKGGGHSVFSCKIYGFSISVSAVRGIGLST